MQLMTKESENSRLCRVWMADWWTAVNRLCPDAIDSAALCRSLNRVEPEASMMGRPILWVSENGDVDPPMSDVGEGRSHDSWRR